MTLRYIKNRTGAILTLCAFVFITCTYSGYNFVLKFRGFFLGQQGQTQDYSKAWEEYYKKQGIVFIRNEILWGF